LADLFLGFDPRLQGLAERIHGTVENLRYVEVYFGFHLDPAFLKEAELSFPPSLV